MAKIEKLKKYIDGVLKTIYPATIPQAVIDPNSGKTVRTELNERMGISEEEVIATDLNALSERVSALEAAFRNMIIEKIQVDSIDVLKDLHYQGRPLFIVSDEAPSIAPDGVPQFWINTTNGNLYSAKASNNAGDWIQI